MRRLMWYCALLGLLGAAGIYLCADYANRHPNSLFGQCVIGGYGAGTVCNPVAQVSGAGVERTFEAIQGAMGRPGMAPTTVAVAPADPEHADVEVPADPEPVLKGESPDGAAQPGRVIIQPDPEEAAGDRGPAAGGAEEAEVPPPMPPAREDDLPPKMPYAADDDRDVGHGLDVWWKLIQEAGHCTDAAPAEECEPAPPDTGACREDPNYDQQYPACPHMGPCPHAGCCPHPGKCPGLDPVVEEKATPDPKHDATEEESTPVEKEPALPRYDRDGARKQKHRDVDTTEFRPSDGLPFDFGSFP
jgi:hypothetical protein